MKVAIEIKSKVEGMAQTESKSDPRNDNRGMLYRNNGKKVDIGKCEDGKLLEEREKMFTHSEEVLGSVSTDI